MECLKCKSTNVIICEIYKKRIADSKKYRCSVCLHT